LYLALVAFVAPFIVLAPLNGYLSNSLPRRGVVVGAAAFLVVVLLPFIFLPATGGQLVWLLGLTTMGAAIYQPACDAMLPAAADDAHSTLPRVNGWMALGSVAALVVGVLRGWDLGAAVLQVESASLLWLNALCLATAFVASFPSDRVRPEAVKGAFAGFGRDLARIGRERDTCGSLLGLAGFQALATAACGVLVAANLEDLLRPLLWLGGGAVAGCALAMWQAHPMRNRGLVPFGAAGLLVPLVWGALQPELSATAAFLLGFTGALVVVPLRAAYLAALPADARGNGAAIMNAAVCAVTAGLGLLMYALPTPSWRFGLLAVLALVGAALAVHFLFRDLVENVLECLVWPVYRIRAHGPGAGRLPLRGPLLIVSNHTSYVDMFLIGKVVPRSLVPLLTSVFYDRTFIHFWMVRVVGAIRVEAAAFRREAPELRAAVELLHQGKCLVIFPEARLRTSEEVLLRPFGQGVWHILRALPETVVVPLWIEGGWGSWSSYFRGPPMKNKRIDRWRRIDIGVGVPAPLPPAVLQDQRKTRDYLHAACLACRDYVGLPPTAAPAPRQTAEANDPPPDRVI
jgi:acyl-[acyl-carrier-protein]-phospholipid O-acyltransferase/long-chain-fatty-acid--[acyl-carrier-protein] ligase